MKMQICKYCNLKIQGKSYLLGRHLTKCNKYREFIDKTFTKDFLYQEHIIKGHSLAYINRQFGIKGKKNRILKNKLNEFGLQQQNQYSPTQLLHRSKVAEETDLKLYGFKSHLCKGAAPAQTRIDNLNKNFGVTNVFQLQKVKNKIKRTSRKRYGTDFPMSADFFKEKVKQTCLRRYGVDNVRKSKEIIKKILNSKHKNPYTYSATSKIASELFQIIYNTLPLAIQKHTYFYSKNSKEFGRNCNGKYFYYDFVITNLKKCIEFNGDYWHMNPAIYSEDHIRKIGNSKKTAKQIWAIEQEKINCITAKGFSVLTIWEHDYKENKRKIIKQCLKFLKEN